jgi:DNA mismatch repair protein MutL
VSKIRILSEQLANQIAAGEVVERPASVVKELMENSLDAGATRVLVRIEGNGSRLIQIVDNGMGMDFDDVLLSIERHATSKLHEESQLNGIMTLGFRGEALPSIASVAKMIIVSRPAGNATGTRAEIRYGRLHAIHEEGCAQGTIIEVHNLFANVPARKKFLKSERTELFQIEEVIRNLALAHPENTFTLQLAQRMPIDLLPCELEQRVRDIFHYQGKFLKLEPTTSKAEDPALRGYLLLPEHYAPTSGRLRILVNKRPIQDNTIRHALAEGMQGLLMKGQQPAGALFLELPPDEIDVNVHPAKREIRFRNPGNIRQFLVQATQRALHDYQQEVRTLLFTTKAQGTGTALAPQITEQQPSSQPHPTARQPKNRTYRDFPPQQILATSTQICEPVPPLSDAQEIQHDQNNDFSGLRLIGQLFQLYLLCEKENQLVLIDQHAAHERILYQELREAYQKRDIPSQALLFPVSIELGPEQAERMEKNGKHLETLGLRVEHFGAATWIIKAVPAPLCRLEPKEILKDVLSALHSDHQEEPSAPVPAGIDSLLASMACKAAVKAGNRLVPKEMLALLKRMEKSPFFSHCPHGRPVVRVFTVREIEKWFCRT